MAAVAKSGRPSLATTVPGREHTITGKLATVAISAGDACRITPTGIALSVGAAVNDVAVVDGFAASDCPVGEAVTLYDGVHFHYGANMTVGTFLYLSGTVAGGLDTVAPVGGSQAIVARVLTSSTLLLKRSY